MGAGFLFVSDSLLYCLQVEITIRGAQEFTLSADGNCCESITKWLKTAPILKSVEARYDEELDASFVYFAV